MAKAGNWDSWIPPWPFCKLWERHSTLCRQRGALTYPRAPLKQECLYAQLLVDVVRSVLGRCNCSRTVPQPGCLTYPQHPRHSFTPSGQVRARDLSPRSPCMGDSHRAPGVSRGASSCAQQRVTWRDPQRSCEAQLFLGTSHNLPQLQGFLLSFAAPWAHCEISPLEMLTARIYAFCSFPLIASAGEALAKDERCWYGMDVRRRLQRLPIHRVALQYSGSFSYSHPMLSGASPSLSTGLSIWAHS